ncbi:LOW QUALITY PROTEIN: hypothetical protein PoB_003598800 [Plakobranchus ocellatus]|uniref:Uncharacterized protein n=1 Tax=Plakobranchus ocellatus TaxID=259542 RepID=A0AAV4ARP4_9GAST|nr:LOW QUALITY PROTEIN: hypothetical protein PoB_003598800 [Plakobranchus ocellatus]
MEEEEVGRERRALKHRAAVAEGEFTLKTCVELGAERDGGGGGGQREEGSQTQGRWEKEEEVGREKRALKHRAAVAEGEFTLKTFVELGAERDGGGGGGQRDGGEGGGGGQKEEGSQTQGSCG